MACVVYTACFPRDANNHKSQRHLWRNQTHRWLQGPALATLSTCQKKILFNLWKDQMVICQQSYVFQSYASVVLRFFSPTASSPMDHQSYFCQFSRPTTFGPRVHQSYKQTMFEQTSFYTKNNCAFGAPPFTGHTILLGRGLLTIYMC